MRASHVIVQLCTVMVTAVIGTGAAHADPTPPDGGVSASKQQVNTGIERIEEENLQDPNEDTRDMVGVFREHRLTG
jgi:hypothetical protein